MNTTNTQDPIKLAHSLEKLIMEAPDRWTAGTKAKEFLLAALQPAAAKPPGDAREAVYRAMPYEPTEEMRWAGKVIDPGLTHGQLRAIWSAMWSAAPQLATAQASGPLTDDWIRERCGQTWVFETVRSWVREVERAHGITAPAAKAGNGGGV